MKIIDDNSKTITKFNRNYFYAGTLLIIVINILLFAIMGGSWQDAVGNTSVNWSGLVDLSNIFRSFLNVFSHANWQHVLLNMLCFLVVGLYLERKKGTFIFLGLILLMAFLGSSVTTACRLHIFWHGFSIVNYALYACVIVDFAFSFKKQTRTKTNIVWGTITVLLIYLAMCFTGGTSGFGFTWYPHDLLYTIGHYCGFIVGLIISLSLQIQALIITRRKE